MEIMVIKIKTCQLTSILTKLKLTWKTIIFQNSDTWKIELTMAINISSKNTKEEGVRCKDVLNMTSFANAQGTLKIGLTGSKV